MTEAKYKTLLETLKADILNGKYASGRPFPSVRALEQRFGIARSTIGHALDELCHQGLISRKQGRGTFVTGDGIVRTIGLILPGLAYSEFFQPIASTLIRLSKEKGVTLLFGDVFSKEQDMRIVEARELAADFVRKRVSGVIYQPLEYCADGGATNRRILSVFGRAKIPVVLLDSDIVPPPARSAYDRVSINNVSMGDQLADHLIEGGAKNPVFLMRPNWVPNVQDRYRGFLLAKQRRGLAGQKDDLLLAEPEDVRAVRVFMRRRPRPDAFVCENDTAAAALRATLGTLGYSVPADVRLAGFDDLRIARLTMPPLTTIHQPCEDIAGAAFRRLLYRIAHPHAPPQEIFLPSPLVVRESSLSVGGKRPVHPRDHKC